MKKLSIYLIALFLIPAIVFTGCKDKVEVDPAFKIMKDYMTANSKDLGDIIKYHDTSGDIKFVTGAPATADLATFLAKYTILDLRSATDFAAGHIEGAKNIAFADILTEAAAASKQILVVCYTGQTACYATSLIRLYGYPKTQALKWGMSGWNADFDKWTANVSNIADGNANWSTSSTPTVTTFDDPVLTETMTDGNEILKARVEVVVTNGFQGKTATDVLDNPTTYFINNYFSDAHYTSFGHIDGAYRINPLTLADDIYKGLDPAGKIITYCYTGQTSAVITAYLNVLGYEAYSLKFGMNGLWNENTGWGTPEDDVTNQWGVDSNPKDLPYVTSK